MGGTFHPLSTGGWHLSSVLSGPYRYVRNPMALAGVLQGGAVGWLLGSSSVVGYSLAGAVVWHLFVRPIEEADLQKRFGDNYRMYQHRVRLWLPTFAINSESTLGIPRDR
nr:isoprenylcysteine carboxylmethyltransferase family protein [Stieleria neptunia]